MLDRRACWLSCSPRPTRRRPAKPGRRRPAVRDGRRSSAGGTLPVAWRNRWRGATPSRSPGAGAEPHRSSRTSRPQQSDRRQGPALQLGVDGGGLQAGVTQQVRDGLHRHIPAHHLGREGVSETWAPGRGTVTPARRSARWSNTRHASAAELAIRGGARLRRSRPANSSAAASATRRPRPRRHRRAAASGAGVPLCRLHGPPRCASRRRDREGCEGRSGASCRQRPVLAGRPRRRQRGAARRASTRGRSARRLRCRPESHRGLRESAGTPGWR